VLKLSTTGEENLGTSLSTLVGGMGGVDRRLSDKSRRISEGKRKFPASAINSGSVSL
jgi:hypothetical protein